MNQIQRHNCCAPANTANAQATRTTTIETASLTELLTPQNSTLLLIDYRLRGAEVISSSYFRIRTIATTIAVISLLAVIFVGTASAN